MADIIPVNQVTIADVKAVKEQLERALIELTAKVLEISPEEVVVREGLPTELAFATDVWEQSLSAGENTTVDTNVPERKFFGFFAVGNLAADPLTTFVRFESRAFVYDIWTLEKLYTHKEVPEGISFEPVVYRQKEPIKIIQYAKVAGTDKLYLRFLVAEPVGETISVPAKK